MGMTNYAYKKKQWFLSLVYKYEIMTC